MGIRKGGTQICDSALDRRGGVLDGGDRRSVETPRYGIIIG